jgi:hypothetical protein
MEQIMTLSSTLAQYRESYLPNLNDFLNNYEDNTKAFFLQGEKEKYQAYQNALTKISNQLQLFSREELNNNLVHKSIAADLKNISIEAYNKIITELNETPNDGILSLSNLKNDKISIDEKTLKNHIKSSIVILKFISEEYEEALNAKVFDNRSLTSDNELEQIDSNLWNWLKKYESTNEYISIPIAIEEKADYVIDTFKNYEERNFKYQLEICNIILDTVPNEKIILEHKKKYEIKLAELRIHHTLPSKNIDALIDEINNAFYRLEKFMKGDILEYKSYLFNDAFTLLFNELNKLENVNIKYDSITNTYWSFMNQLDYAYDKGEFENQEAYANEHFNRDCNEISYIQWHRMEELNGKSDLDDYKFEVPSIISMFNNPEIEKAIIPTEEKSNPIENEKNPYPRIFKNFKAYIVFKNLLEEFGTSKDSLANYSFVYHRMKKDELIYDDFQQLQFTYFLLDFNIKIDRIKRMDDIGKIDYRESIYSKAK